MAHHELATSLWRQGQLKEAESYFRLALESRVKELGVDHPHVLANQVNLALDLMDQGKLAEAEALFRTLMVHVDAKYAKDHPESLQRRGLFAVLLQKQGKLEEAATMMAEVLKQKITKFGPDHPNVLSTRYNLACVYQEQKKNVEAERLLVENVPYCDKKFGPMNPNTIRVKLILADVSYDLKKYAQAEPLYQQCLTAKRQGQLQERGEVNLESSLGFVLFKQGKLDEAEKILLAAYDKIKLPTDSKFIQYYQPRIAQLLVELYEARKQPADVTKWKAEADRWKPVMPPGK